MTVTEFPLMVALPAGRVTTTDARTRITRTEDVAAFEIGITPITLSEFGDVQHGSGRLPVADVSWWDAIQFCNRLSNRAGHTPAYILAGEQATWDSTATGYRLPTETEWEYACRAGSTGPRYGPIDSIAWYRDNANERPHDVGGKQPNAWGLYDTLGDVWEWCWDFSDPERYGSYRAMRGGGWFDRHWSCRASVRRGSYPGLKIDDVGFRIARGAALA